MILVKPSFEILALMNEGRSLELIEKGGRTCYKSEDKITTDSAKRFVNTILKNGHESVIEHSAMTVKFVVDRGVTHELVRHRLCSFSQESTSYVNYKGGCTFVIPPWITSFQPLEYSSEEILTDYIDSAYPEDKWLCQMASADISYRYLLASGWSPQQARSVLPNSTKTEIVMTTNFREWRHIFKLCTSPKAHPQMQEIMRPLLDECKKLIPIIFDDINY